MGQIVPVDEFPDCVGVEGILDDFEIEGLAEAWLCSFPVVLQKNDLEFRV